MYYEAHVTFESTLEPASLYEWTADLRFSTLNVWRLSRFEGDFDPGMFLSARSTTYDDLETALKTVVNDIMRRDAMKLIRYKIEHVVLDSRTCDVFDLLSRRQSTTF